MSKLAVVQAVASEDAGRVGILVPHVHVELRIGRILRAVFQLYVFVPTTAGVHAEADFTGGSVSGEWVKIQGASGLSDVELETEADAVGALGFVRIEDGAFAKTNAKDFYLVTTGGNSALGNGLGRGYHLRLNAGDVLGQARLDVIYNADLIVAAGGDVALSPDNIDTSRRYLMIQEDGTSTSRPVMDAKGREGSIWRFALDDSQTTVDAGSAIRVVRISPASLSMTYVGADGPSCSRRMPLTSTGTMVRLLWLFRLSGGRVHGDCALAGQPWPSSPPIACAC